MTATADPFAEVDDFLSKVDGSDVRKKSDGKRYGMQEERGPASRKRAKVDDEADDSRRR